MLIFNYRKGGANFQKELQISYVILKHYDTMKINLSMQLK